MVRLPIVLAVLVLLWPFAGHGKTVGIADLPEGGRGTVASVIDGDTVRLAGGDRDVRLIGIQAPRLPLGRANVKPQPLAEEARRAWEVMLQNHTVTLRLGTTSRDRNGRVLAHLERDDGLWIQMELLRQGWARVYTFPDNRQFAEELYAAEREARTAKRGIWANAAYAVRDVDPEKLTPDLGNFQIIEGSVVNAAKVRGRGYLNFGSDFLTDFTASIPPEAMPLFSRVKLDPVSLKGKVVRVRGYLRDYRGPLIELSHPEQIEIISAP